MEIAKYVDVMIGNEEDFTACLGLEVEGNDAELKELNLDGYRKYDQSCGRNLSKLQGSGNYTS